MISDFGIGVIHFDQSVRQIKLMQIFWNIETLLSHEKNDFSNTFTLFDFFLVKMTKQLANMMWFLVQFNGKCGSIGGLWVVYVLRHWYPANSYRLSAIPQRIVLYIRFIHPDLAINRVCAYKMLQSNLKRFGCKRWAHSMKTHSKW